MESDRTFSPSDLKAIWRINGSEGSDQTQVIFNSYSELRGGKRLKLRLNEVVVTTGNQQALSYRSGSEGISFLGAVFINEPRSTLTVAFQDDSGQPQYATFRRDKIHAKTIYTKIRT